MKVAPTAFTKPPSRATLVDRPLPLALMAMAAAVVLKLLLLAFNHALPWAIADLPLCG
jgi:hypothetical protein